MNKFRILTVFFVSLLIGLLVVPAFCQEKTKTPIPTDPTELLQTADEVIFVRSAFIQGFSEDQGYVNELPNANTIHQYYIYKGVGSDVLMSMLPSETTIRTTNKRLTFDQARKDEFHVTYSVQQTETIPGKTGGKCWIRYSNVALVGKGRESGIILYPGDHAYFFTPGENEMSYEIVADLSDLNPEKQIRFEFIRLNGISYFYANGKFLFHYEDQIKETVSFESGAELSKDGNRIRCDYDDFTMRTK